MTTQLAKVLIGAATLAALLISLFWWTAIGRFERTVRLKSVSSDGAFRCEVSDAVRGGASITHIEVFGRKNTPLTSRVEWKCVGRGDYIADSSLRRSPYAIAGEWNGLPVAVVMPYPYFGPRDAREGRAPRARMPDKCLASHARRPRPIDILRLVT
jgi:hypothetical protein